MNILVTGGAGFVGSNLSIGLRRMRPEISVTALDNLHRRGSELNLPRLRNAGVKFLHGDVRNYDDLLGAAPADLILECSAEPSVLAGYAESPQYLIDTNLSGCINCLEFARTLSADIIFLSTSRVYPISLLNELSYRESATRFVLNDDQALTGASARGISEEFPLNAARSLYGATKLCAELLVQEYIDAYGLRGIVNRCGIIAGPWQMGRVDQGVISLWAARHIYGGSLAYIGYGGTGKQVRDLLHVDDLLDLLIYEIDHFGELNGRVFNVGGGIDVSVSLQELTILCQEITGKTIPISAEPETRTADIPIYVSDSRRIREATTWRPRRDVHTIVSDICKWILQNQESLRHILA